MSCLMYGGLAVVSFGGGANAAEHGSGGVQGESGAATPVTGALTHSGGWQFYYSIDVGPKAGLVVPCRPLACISQPHAAIH